MSASKDSRDVLRGAYCPIVVPFKRNGAIDYDAYAALIERQAAEGSHGLAVNVTSGEVTMLTMEERASLVEFAVKTSAGRLPVCAGTAAQSLEETLALVDRYDRLDVNSILVVTPYYSAPPQRGVVSYFAKVGEHTKKPLLAYHIPGRAAFRFSVDTLVAIKDKVPNFVGLKNTDSDVDLVTAAFGRLGRDFRIFAGADMPTLPMLAIGCCGMMITASNVAPRLVANLYETFAKGDINGACNQNIALYPLLKGVGLESSPIPVKYMLKKMGVLKANTHRLPMVPAAPETERQLDQVLKQLHLV